MATSLGDYDKEQLAKKYAPVLRRIDVALTSIERKTGKPREMEWEETWDLDSARSTHNVLQMRFGHNLDLPIMWPDYLDRYEKIVNLSARLDLEAKRLGIDVSAEIAIQDAARKRVEEEAIAKVAVINAKEEVAKAREAVVSAETVMAKVRENKVKTTELMNEAKKEVAKAKEAVETSEEAVALADQVIKSSRQTLADEMVQTSEQTVVSD